MTELVAFVVLNLAKNFSPQYSKVEYPVLNLSVKIQAFQGKALMDQLSVRSRRPTGLLSSLNRYYFMLAYCSDSGPIILN